MWPDVVSEAHVDDAGFTHRFGIVVDVLDTVADARVAAAGIVEVVAYKHQVGVGSHAVVFVTVVGSGCDTGHVGGVAVGHILLGRYDRLGGRIFPAVVVTRGRRTRSVLVPDSLHAQVFAGRVVEVDVVVLETAVDDTHHDIFTRVGLGEARAGVQGIDIGEGGATYRVHEFMYRTSNLDILDRGQLRYCLEVVGRNAYREDGTVLGIDGYTVVGQSFEVVFIVKVEECRDDGLAILLVYGIGRFQFGALHRRGRFVTAQKILSRWRHLLFSGCAKLTGKR